MRINIWELGLALYAGELKYLDLDTGIAYSKFCVDCGWEKMPENKRILPRYSSAHVYQKYLGEILPKTGIEDTIHLETYPDFPLMVSDGWEKRMLEFVSKADHFLAKPVWCDYERLQKARKENGSPDFDPTFVPYREYSDAFKRRTAIEWCEKEGYEWYEDDFPHRPLSR